MDIGAEANVTDGAAEALMDELVRMGLTWISLVLAGAKLVLLPNVKEKKANGFHERRFVRGQGLVPHQGVRVRSTMRVGLMGDAGSWLMRATQELRKRGDSQARRDLWQRVQTVMNAMQVDLELWSTSADGQPGYKIVNVPAEKMLYKNTLNKMEPPEVRRTMACPPATQEQRLDQNGQEVDPASQEAVYVDGSSRRSACAFEFSFDFFYGATCVDLGVPGKVVQRFVLRDGNGNRLTVDTPQFVVVSNKTTKGKGYPPYDIALCADLGTGLGAAAVTGDGASSGSGSSMPVEEEDHEDPVEAEENDAVLAFFRGTGVGGNEGFLAEVSDLLDGLKANWAKLGLNQELGLNYQRTSPEHQAALEKLISDGENAPEQQPPKRQRRGDDTEFRSCAAPGDADDAPPRNPRMRGLSNATEAAPAPAAATSPDTSSVEASPSASQPCYRGLPAPLDKLRAAAAAVKAMNKLKALVARVVHNKQAMPADCAELVQLRQSCVVHSLVQG